MKIRIFAQRHGERNGDELTQAGIEQIKKSKSHKLMKTASFIAYYASPKRRSQQTAAILAGTSENVRINYGLYIPLADAHIDLVWGSVPNQNADISEWISELPRSWGVRYRQLLLASFEEMARHAASEFPHNSKVDIYACGHSASIEFALSPELLDTPVLAPGEFIIYTFDLTNEAFSYMSAEIVRS